MYIAQFNAKAAMQRPITIDPEKTIMDARNSLLKYNISRIAVARDHRPFGIITEKDIARFLYDNTASKLDEIRIDEVMSKDLVTVDEEKDLRACAKIMLDKQISSLLVVDNSRMLKGILTKTDLLHAYIEYFSRDHLVRQFMTDKVITVMPDEPVHSAILLMSGNTISRVIVAKDNQPVGIITGRDLLPVAGLFSDSYPNTRKDSGSRPPFIPAGIKAVLLTKDVMRPDPVSIDPDSDLADAAYIMVRHRISGLPVVGPDHILKGIVTKTDVVKALAEHA